MSWPSARLGLAYRCWQEPISGTSCTTKPSSSGGARVSRRGRSAFSTERRLPPRKGWGKRPLRLRRLGLRRRRVLVHVDDLGEVVRDEDLVVSLVAPDHCRDG